MLQKISIANSAVLLNFLFIKDSRKTNSAQILIFNSNSNNSSIVFNINNKCFLSSNGILDLKRLKGNYIHFGTVLTVYLPRKYWII